MRILAMAGSTRRDSFNRKLLAVGVKAAEAAGAEVEVIDLKELAIPLYDGDLEKEQGLPPGAQRLKDALAEAQGLLIATPENNHSIPAVLKNAIDWASRPPSNALAGKTAALMAASTGGFGGVRVLMQLRIPMHTAGGVGRPRPCDDCAGGGGLRRGGQSPRSGGYQAGGRARQALG